MAEVVEKGLRKIGITVSKPILAILCIIFGIIVIAWPEFLSLIDNRFVPYNRGCSTVNRLFRD